MIMWVLDVLPVIIVALLTLRCDVVVCSTDEWPLGSYTVPKPISGCPHTANTTWQEAWRFQDLDNDAKQGSKFSSNFHMDATLVNNDISRGFCTRLNSGVQEPWPVGSYCIYRNSNYCPPNMKDGFIDMYDEQTNNQNKLRNYYLLPDGLYNSPSTGLLYCCHIEGKWYNSIELPTEKPFYLLPYGSRNCQRVKWAVSSLEYIIYDTEDYNNRDEFEEHHVFTNQVKSLPQVFYCYYEGCQFQFLNRSSGSFSSSNVLNNSYPDFQYCSWSITVNVSLQISLKFSTLNIPNCEENFLDIYDGDNGSTILARFCGENATSGTKVISRTNQLYIVVKSGNNSAAILSKRIRFQAEYKAVDAAPLLTMTGSPTSIPTTTRRSSTRISTNPTTTMSTTTRKILFGPAIVIPGNKVYLNTISSPTSPSTTKTKRTSTTTTMLTTTRKLLLGTAIEISRNITVQNTATFSNSLSTTRRKTTPTSTETSMNNNERQDLRNASKENLVIFWLIAIPVLAILILLGMVGAMLYWRNTRKDAVITEIENL